LEAVWSRPVWNTLTAPHRPRSGADRLDEEVPV